MEDWFHYFISIFPQTAAAAKSLQSCPTLCNPRDCSPPGSAVPGILQARTLEWVAIAFSSSPKLNQCNSLVALTVKCLPAMWEIQVRSLGWEDPLEKEMATHSKYSCLENSMDGGACWAIVHGVTKSQTRLSDFTYFT